MKTKKHNKTGVIRNVDNEKQTVLFTPILYTQMAYCIYILWIELTMNKKLKELPCKIYIWL